MDYRDMLRQHVETKADITMATIPVERLAARDFGIMVTDEDRRIREFVEKPKADAVLDGLRIPTDLLKKIGQPPEADLYQASMGIYIFNRSVLEACLDNDFVDFGKNVIPAAISKYQVMAFIFQGYWEDIGTIRAFFEANLNLADPHPQYSFYETGSTIFTHPRFLPASVISSATIERAMISDGCIIGTAKLERCVLGIRSIVQSGSTLKNTIMMGADVYESEVRNLPAGLPAIGVGRDCVINGAIIDKNARIGNSVVITPEGKSHDVDGDGYYIRDGIVVVPKNSVIQDGTWI
jgi:glucose-1-phosphate adenylyltransferase